MRNSQGYSQLFGPGLDGLKDPGLAALQKDKEADTFTCGHCNCVTHVPANTDAANIGGLCKVCMAFVCPKCASLGICSPFEKQLELQLTREYRMREYV